MNGRIMLILIALAVAAGTGGWYLLNRQEPAQNAATQQDAQRFFAERGGGTPVAGGPGDQMVVGGPGAGGALPGVIGEVTQVDSAALKVKNPMDGTVTDVQLPAGVPVRKQDATTATDLKPGEQVMVIAPGEGDEPEAMVVQIGNAGDGTITMGAAAPPPGGASGGPVIINRPLGAGEPPAGAAPGGKVPEPLNGTIEKVDGKRLTLKTADGKQHNFTLGAATEMRKWTTTGVADIKVGMHLLVEGQRDGTGFTATAVQVLSAP